MKNTNMLTNQCKAIGCTNRISVSTGQDFCSDCQEDTLTVVVATPADTVETMGLQLSLNLERDPAGLDQHQGGAKVDAGKVRMHLITGGMARAITEVAKVATFGAAKYVDNGWISVPDGFRRYEDAQQRHAAKRHMDEVVDTDSNLLHLAHEAWNCLAKLDLYLREQEAQKQQLHVTAV